MIKIKATPQFMRLAKKVMTEKVLQELVDVLTFQPEKGALIAGTGGIRKIRCRTGKSNKGKSGGIRVLYYYEKDTIVLLITLFKKSDQDNIDEADKVKLKKQIPQLLKRYKNE